MPDVVIPIVFPDYIITVETPTARIEIPDIIPYIDILPNEIRVPHTQNRLSDLGHAGVLFINGNSGVTKYYEYGRYDANKLGWIKKILNLKDVRIGSNGKIDEFSLADVLLIISRKAGKGGRISAAYIEVDKKYDAMLAYAENRRLMNVDKNRERYDIVSYSCIHFIKGVMEAAGLDTPWLIDPRPVSYIEEIQEDYPELQYIPSQNQLIIEKSEPALGSQL
ncbi:MAG: hypothetical protein GY737_22060 [Desulfobacteraceae bacterium]|nr:hypothetical protein [Desulfobacteraceae bacterium]